MPIAIVMVVWGLWMGIVFGPHQGEKGFMDKDKPQIEVRK